MTVKIGDRVVVPYRNAAMSGTITGTSECNAVLYRVEISLGIDAIILGPIHGVMQMLTARAELEFLKSLLPKAPELRAKGIA